MPGPADGVDLPDARVPTGPQLLAGFAGRPERTALVLTSAPSSGPRLV
jgi:hypothetical protein